MKNYSSWIFVHCNIAALIKLASCIELWNWIKYWMNRERESVRIFSLWRMHLVIVCLFFYFCKTWCLFHWLISEIWRKEKWNETLLFSLLCFFFNYSTHYFIYLFYSTLCLGSLFCLSLSFYPFRSYRTCENQEPSEEDDSVPTF